MSNDFNPDSVDLPACHLIGGERVTYGEELSVYRPSDGLSARPIPVADEAMVDRAVSNAHEAFKTSGWAQSSPMDRAAVLHRWADLLDANRERIARIEAVSSTRPIDDLLARDLVRAAGALRYFAEWADKVEGQLFAGKAGATTFAKPEPFGVVAAIAPFNFPAINAIWKSAPALAVGNAVVLKPSEATPYSAVAIAELALEAGLAPGLFNVVLGAGETGSWLVRHPFVRKITFTGSSMTGARVMADAALSGTKPVTLELGGKTPQLVLRDIRDVDAVANNVANGFLANAGQVCTAGSRLIAPANLRDELLEKIIAIANDRQAGPTWASGNTLPPIISEKQAERIDRMLEETRKDGAEILLGGNRIADINSGAYYQPTILGNVPDTSIGFTDEFFGPVLSVYAYEDEEEGIAMANHPVYALAASVYTDDLSKAMSLPDRIEAGTVWINAHGRQPDFFTPQGGFNGSGFGKEMGRSGLESFLRFKTVLVNHSG
jgi:aldehyde dehydrogenase (NAD+)